MKRRVIFAIAACLPLAPLCGQEVQPTSSAPQVRRIELPLYQSNLPDAPGREPFAIACLSCHSASYVPMQPPQPAAKWEEVVRKMIKVYAAPITEDQVAPIAQYIVAVKESGQDELTESLVPAPPAQKPQVVAVATDEARRAADAKRGETLFATNCASCHGARSGGDGFAAKTQLPPPTDLTSHRYSTEALCAAITRGVPATAMPGYPDLSDDDLRAIVTFTQQLTAADVTPPAAAVVAPEVKSLFAQNCQACHGATGNGDGPIAPTSPRPPASFRNIRPSRDHALRVISEGVPATTMPPWKTKLTESQREALADYVRSLFVETNAQ